MKTVVATLALLSSPAFADDDEHDVTSRDAVLFDTGLVAAKDLGFRWRSDAVVAALASGTGAGGVGAISTEIAVTESPDCDLLTLGAQMSARSDEQRAISAEQWGSFCFFAGDGKPTTDGHLALRHHFAWDTRPRFLAVPGSRSSAARHEVIELVMSGSHAPYDPVLQEQLRIGDPVDFSTVHDWWQGGELRLATDVAWTDRGGDSVRIDFDVVAFRSFMHQYDDGPPLKLDLLGLHLIGQFGLGTDTDTAYFDNTLARVEGLRLGGLRFGAKLAGILGGLGSGSGMETKTAMVTVGEWAASVERDVTAHEILRAGIDRSANPTFDGRLAIDDRATLSARSQRGKLRAQLDLAVATTHLVGLDGVSRSVGTYGTTLDVSYALDRAVTLKSHTEAGRSTYARGASLDDPRLGVESMVMLAVHAGR